MSDPVADSLERLLVKYINFRDHEFPGAIDAILAEFLVVPRSDIVDTEYGVYGVEGGDSLFRVEDKASALRDAAKIRSMNLPAMAELGVVAQAMERPVLPWTPIPFTEPTPCTDCGYPDGRQSGCRTCAGQPIPEEGAGECR